MSTLSNVTFRRGEANPLSVMVALDTIPEAKSSQTGVSVNYTPDYKHVTSRGVKFGTYLGLPTEEKTELRITSLQTVLTYI